MTTSTDGSTQRMVLADVPDHGNASNGKQNNPTSTSEESWMNITKNDRPLTSDKAIRVMDHAHMVLQKRLSEVEGGLEIFNFETNLARFQNSEIELGKRLGWGNFADIYVVKAFHPSRKSKICTQNQIEAAEEVKRDCDPDSVVVKILRAQLLANPNLYATGAADVVTEGTLLASLDHPHIVAIKGRSVPSVEGFASGKRDAFFLLLERVHCNLNDRLKEWHQRTNNNRILVNGVKKLRDCRTAILRERIEVMTDLADAMEYLHKMGIIHRDLKLSNVGIDVNGKAKLLDFGLAKVLPPNINDKETFKLTGNTGSVRYMAPEIGRGEQYNLKADVYSFGILLYEVLNLEKAWSGWQPPEIRDKVHNRKQRPAVSMFWPAPLRDLLKSTWSDLPAARLSMKHVHTVLQNVLKDLSL